MPTLNWTLALEKNTYDFTTPDTGTAALATLLRADLTAADPVLSELHGQREYSADDRYCRYLQRRSRESLTSEPVILAHPATAGSSEQEALIRSPELLLQLCAACHGAGAAPPVPFDRPDQLASWPHKPARHGELIDEILFRMAPEAGSQRMPPNTVLTPTEREVISKFLLDLATRHDSHSESAVGIPRKRRRHLGLQRPSGDTPHVAGDNHPDRQES